MRYLKSLNRWAIVFVLNFVLVYSGGLSSELETPDNVVNTNSPVFNLIIAEEPVTSAGETVTMAPEQLVHEFSNKGKNFVEKEKFNCLFVSSINSYVPKVKNILFFKLKMIELDNKIKYFINKGNNLYQRCMFLLFGRNSSENVPVLISIRNFENDYEPKILWCFKIENSYIKRSGKNNRKFEHSLKKMDIPESNFDNFVNSSNINWCHYNDSDNILGMTYDVCVLQDFESLTPNIIAKVIETVKGGGLILFLLPNHSKLSDFGDMEMDVHKKYKTFSYDKVDFRFNYRFFYSLMNHNSCLVLDNNMEICPINGSLISLLEDSPSSIIKKSNKKLEKMKKNECIQHVDISKLIELCATKDQTNAFINLIQCFEGSSQTKLNSKPKFKRSKLDNNFLDHLHMMSMVTAGRGRGKSALLGLSIAAAIHRGLTNICVTSPSLDNVGTLMHFVTKGLVALGYVDNEHFVKRTQPLSSGKGHGVSYIEIVKDYRRQTVKYIQPTEHESLDQIDLLCIDETAAIPLPTVRKLLALKCNVVFMSSTIHGYEGTGRSLSLKLMKQIKESFSAGDNKDRFCEVTLNDPIRYSSDDGVEKWLNAVLCLDCGNELGLDDDELRNNQPSLADCQLFVVNRDLLFSGHRQSEVMLQRLMGIYVASHYKNSPNDLQMLADSSSHALFCLGKSAAQTDGYPIICAVVQVAFEGGIDPLVARASIEKGLRPSGDMTTWTVVQQFSEYDFAKLSGGRVVRVAVHPSLQRQGYGGRALALLHEYLEAGRSSEAAAAAAATRTRRTATMSSLVTTEDSLVSSVTAPPSLASMGPLLVTVDQAPPPPMVDYLSVSFGLTSDLLRFWKKSAFAPVYLRQTTNDSTGEHSCIMIRPMTSSESVNNNADWLQTFNNEFCRRFSNLLAGPFRKMDSILALELLQKKFKTISLSKQELTRGDVMAFLNESDFVRIDKYQRNLLDYHAIVDLVFSFAILHNTRRIDKVKLPKFQELVLVGMGLQHKTVDELTRDLASLVPLPASGKTTSSSEVLGHLRDCVKTLSKATKSLLK